jgi:SNF2 family DNA or RNA helicase
MLVATKQKALLLNLRNPERVTTLIPTAKVIDYKGRRMTAVPHRHEEVKVLQNIGIKAPSPIRYYYGWPGQYKPFAAQLETAEFLSSHTRAYCLNSMGTGKTVSGLWAYDYLRSIGLAGRLLVVAPLSTLERTWGDEVFRHFPHLTCCVLHGSADRRRKLLAQMSDIYVINHDGLGTVEDLLAVRADITHVIIDELALYRNKQTDRWKKMNSVVNKSSFGPRTAWGFTGTPIPNDPTDAWAQCRMLTPDTVPPYFNRFREKTMQQISQWKWVHRPDAIDTVYGVMQPSIRFSLDDCTDLPEQVFTEHDAPMTADQQKAYKAMARQLLAEYAGGQILAVNEAVKASKLLQIACGVVYGADGLEVTIAPTERLRVLSEIVEQSEGKVIVFVPFTGALNMVADHLRTKYTVAIVNGEVKKTDRDEIFGCFQKRYDPHVIVAQPGTMSHGLTLTAATTIVWYGLCHSHETFAQANARVRRPGQTRATVIAALTGSPVERRILDRLRNRESTQGLLLDMVKEGLL